MTSIVEEKASELFSRFASTSATYSIEKKLFPDLSCHDIVEIYGGSGSGKTELLYHFIAKCILPKSWKGLPLEGSDMKVIFVDNDCHFDLLRLITILETRLKIYRKKFNPAITSAELSSFIEERIKLLEIVKCFDSGQFLLTLHSLETLLSLVDTKTVMMIDGVTSFYWSDKLRAQIHHTYLLTLHTQIITQIKKISKNCKIPVFATRRKLSDSVIADRKILGQSWKTAVTKMLELTFQGSQPDRTVISLLDVNTGCTHLCGIGKFGFSFMSKSTEAES